MQYFIVLFSLLLFSCNKDDDTDQENNEPQNISILVQPIQTSNEYSATEQSHFIVRNDQIHLNKLLLFIGGSFSTPENYSLLCDHAATLGLDVISLSYPNKVPAATLGASSDKFIFDNYREELCFGDPVSDAVDVNILNSINTRTIKLLEFLNIAYPEQKWNQYLASSNTLQWNNIIVAGHSQGAGHACYLGKKNMVDKVVMFSGPNDYSKFYNAPANWLTVKGNTPLSKQFSLLHTRDQIVMFSNQVEILRGLGSLALGENPTLVDKLTPPYANANSLSLNIFAISNHNSTIGKNSILPEIWTYMLVGE